MSAPATAAAAAGAMALVAVVAGSVGAVLGSGGAPGPTGMCGAPADIPARYLTLYRDAGARYGIPWNVLAAVGKAESDHGRDTSPGITHGTNPAGAAGPMQFMPATWHTYGLDGDHDGHTDIYDPADAIPAAARYLKANGAPTHLDQALFHYNHDTRYLANIRHLAAAYATTANTSCTITPIAGTGAAATAVAAAARWLDTPYSWGGGGLNGPTHGIGQGAATIGFDCSGLTRYAWHQAGITLPRTAADQWHTLHHIPPGQQAPGDLIFFRGADGSPSNPGHVGLIVDAQRMIEAPHTGLNVRVSQWTQRRDLIGFGRP